MTGRTIVDVVRAGVLTTVQDEGRAGFAHLGVTRSGALDAAAHRAANAAVGNAAGAATLEITTVGPGVGGCVLRPRARVRAAVSGAMCRVLAGSIPAPFGAAFWLDAGQPLELLPADRGGRSYVAFAGGVEVDPELGSRSTCLLTGLGPAPLSDGDHLPIGAPVPGATVAAPAGSTATAATDPDEPVLLPLTRGPRDDWFTPDAVATLGAAEYTVGGDSNRIALRLEGPPLTRRRGGELESEGMVLGAVQVPPSGVPIVFLNDHPTTGGYPVIGVVAPAGLALAAQLRAGDRVTFGVE